MARVRYLIITFACGLLLLAGAPLAQAEISSPADVSPFRYIGARISCLPGAPPQIRYKADGVDYAPNRKIDIVLEVRLNDSLEPDITRETSLYTTNTGSWSTSTYTNVEILSGTWDLTAFAYDASTGQFLGNNVDSCQL